MATKQTATEIAIQTYEENLPIDWERIRYIKRNYTFKEKLDWARNNCAYFAEEGTSKHMITKASKELLSILNMF